MEKYTYITDFFKKDYLEYLLERNITMIHIRMGKTITFLAYKDELFIFDSTRSLNRAYKFYNVDKELCLEGIEYFKITKNYLNYMKKDDINVKKGVSFKVNKVNYLINYFSKGFRNDEKLSVAKVNKKMYFIDEFCQNIIANDLKIKNNDEKTAFVYIKNKVEYVIDLYGIDTIEPNELTNKFPANKYLREIVSNKEAILADARIGIFFTDGYKDCLTLEETRSGGFIYFSLGNDNLMVYKFDFISLKNLYIILAELFSEFIPLTLTTDNEFLFDILQKTFIGKVDFILDKANQHNRFIRELAIELTMNDYGSYKMDAFTLIIENNYNALINELPNMSAYDFENVLEECCDSYRLSNLENEFDEFSEFEDNELEEENDEIDKVDTTLFS